MVKQIKDEYIQFKVTKEEKEDIEKAANGNISGYMRKLHQFKGDPVQRIMELEEENDELKKWKSSLQDMVGYAHYGMMDAQLKTYAYLRAKGWTEDQITEDIIETGAHEIVFKLILKQKSRNTKTSQIFGRKLKLNRENLS